MPRIAPPSQLPGCRSRPQTDIANSVLQPVTNGQPNPFPGAGNRFGADILSGGTNLRIGIQLPSACRLDFARTFRSAAMPQPKTSNVQHSTPNSPLKKPPGEGTGPTTHADSRGKIVGRVPSRGEQDVFAQAANAPSPKRRRSDIGSWTLEVSIVKCRSVALSPADSFPLSVRDQTCIGQTRPEEG